jgi:hypothetical protein
MVDVVLPVLHEYVVAPLADKVSGWPEHIVVEGNAATLTAGVEFTFMVIVAGADALLQPDAVVTVTEYVVGTVGLTVIEDVVAPVLHEYVPPPFAVSTAELPAHIVDEGDALMVTDGVGFTVTTWVAGADALLQPEAVVTVTE